MNTDQLKDSMDNMKARILEDAQKAHAEIDVLVQHGESAVRDAALKAKEYLVNVVSHFEAYAQTSHVAADATPTRKPSGGVLMPPGRGAPREHVSYGAEPTKLSGIPATPPGGPHGVQGPATTHDDVGHVDPQTGLAHAAPAALGGEGHKLGEVPGKRPVADQSVGDGVESHELDDSHADAQGDHTVEEPKKY